METNPLYYLRRQCCPKWRRQVHRIIDDKPRRVYDAPDKGSSGAGRSRLCTDKAISAGVFLVSFLRRSSDGHKPVLPPGGGGWAPGCSFLAATGILLIMDLDRPDRFPNVLLRNLWKSWLVRGGYSFSITALADPPGAVCLLWLDMLRAPIEWITLVFAVLTGCVYAAFLFAQTKGRDFCRARHW